MKLKHHRPRRQKPRLPSWYGELSLSAQADLVEATLAGGDEWTIFTRLAPETKAELIRRLADETETESRDG